MARKTISMPDDMDTWVEKRIQSGQYNNDSEYFRDLVRKDQEQQAAISSLRKLIDEGEASGVSDKSVSDIMKDVEEGLRQRGQLPTH